MSMEPVCWTTETQIAKAQADPGHNMVIWGEPLPYHPDIPLVRLSDAEARVKELEADKARMRAILDALALNDAGYQSIQKYEARAKAAEALLKALIDDLEMRAVTLPNGTKQVAVSDGVYHRARTIAAKITDKAI